MKEWKTPFEALPVGKGRKICEGQKIAVLSMGHIGNEVVKACNALEKEPVNPAHYDIRFLKPLDTELLHEVMQKFDRIITVEDGAVAGGLGSAVLEFISDHNYQVRVVRLGIPDRFIEQGSQEQLWHECGYDAEGIVNAVKTLLQ